MHKLSNILIFVGIIGFVVAVALNLYSIYTTSASNGAPLFSGNWWARWFPLYASGVAMLFIGLVLRFTSSAH